jgi:hypothetical protein
VIDRIAHKECARERNGQRAEPHKPARGERFFEPLCGGPRIVRRCSYARDDRFFDACRRFRFARRQSGADESGLRRSVFRRRACCCLRRRIRRAAQRLELEAQCADPLGQHGQDALHLVQPMLLVARSNECDDGQDDRNEGEKCFHRIHHES